MRLRRHERRMIVGNLVRKGGGGCGGGCGNGGDSLSCVVGFVGASRSLRNRKGCRDS